MSLLIVPASILLLIILVAWIRLDTFLSFLLVSIFAGLLLGIPPQQLPVSIENGIANTLGSFVIVVVLGAMLGKLVAESGAAQKITEVLMRLFGPRHLRWALMVTGFITGIPLFYNVGFVLLVPLIFSVVYQYRLPAVYVGLPMLAALSVTHGFLPPHPSPVALVNQLHANMGRTLLLGLALAIPAVILAGPLFSRTLKQIDTQPLQTFQPRLLPPDQLPGSFASFFSALLPVLLLITGAVLSYFIPAGSGYLSFWFHPAIVMLLSLLVVTWMPGLRKGMSMKKVMSVYTAAAKDISLILLIIAGAGALKQVLSDSGVSAQIGAVLQHASLPPLVLGWLIAAVIRVCIGSATVAGITAAGIIAPSMPLLNADPSLMVLSIGAGSLLFSHVNDSGFWMFKEYFNLSMKDTLRSWSVMESIVSVTGLAGVLLLQIFL